MPDLLLLNIGTGHGSTEEELITSKLRAYSRFTDIGEIGNHMRGGAGGGAHGRKHDNLSVGGAQNNGWVCTNEGQSSAATGIMDQTKANLKLIKDLQENQGGVDNIYMVAHSRGCILSLRIAAYINETNPDIDVYLFLIDPVKRMSRGTDKYNRQVHANVKDLSIVAMEDPAGAGGAMFKLMSVRRRTGNNVEEVEASKYIRMPGTHGTATQVDGNPIGETTLKLALRFLDPYGVPFNAAPTFDNQSLNSSYMRINIVNPVQQGKRWINDMGSFDQVQSGARDLSSIKKNDWHNSGFFINDHHFAVWSANFQSLFVLTVTDALTDNPRPAWTDEGVVRQLGTEFRKWLAWDPKGVEVLKMTKADVYTRIRRACGVAH